MIVDSEFKVRISSSITSNIQVIRKIKDKINKTMKHKREGINISLLCKTLLFYWSLILQTLECIENLEQFAKRKTKY